MKSKLTMICMLFISATVISYAQTEKDIPPPPPPPKEPPEVVTQKVDVRILKPGVPKEITIQKDIKIPPPPPQIMMNKEIPSPLPPPKKPNRPGII